MGRDDWYRNTSWDEVIEVEFFRRLRRARDKNQPLRIQAWYLAESHPDIALRLLNEYLSYGDRLGRAQAFVDMARAYSTLGDADAALQSLEAALAHEEVFPNVLTLAYLDLPVLIALERMSDRYTRALEILEKHRDRLVFPIEQYQWHGATALLLKELGKESEAEAAATKALEAASIRQSDFRRHRSVGLVHNVEDDFGRRIRKIANRLL